MTGDREDVGEEAPDGFHDPGDVVKGYVELGGGGAEFLNVLPVVVGGDAEEGGGEAVAEAVDDDDSGDEGGGEVVGEHAEP